MEITIKKLFDYLSRRSLEDSTADSYWSGLTLAWHTNTILDSSFSALESYEISVGWVPKEGNHFWFVTDFDWSRAPAEFDFCLGFNIKTALSEEERMKKREEDFFWSIGFEDDYVPSPYEHVDTLRVVKEEQVKDWEDYSFKFDRDKVTQCSIVRNRNLPNPDGLRRHVLDQFRAPIYDPEPTFRQYLKCPDIYDELARDGVEEAQEREEMIAREIFDATLSQVQEELKPEVF